MTSSYMGIKALKAFQIKLARANKSNSIFWLICPRKELKCN